MFKEFLLQTDELEIVHTDSAIFVYQTESVNVWYTNTTSASVKRIIK